MRENIALQRHKILQTILWWGQEMPTPNPHHANICKMLWLCRAISLLVLGLLIMTLLFFLNCCRWDHFKSKNCCLWYYRWKRNSLSRRQRRCLPGSRPDLPIKTWNRKHIQNSATSQAFLPKSKCIVMNFDVRIDYSSSVTGIPKTLG